MIYTDAALNPREIQAISSNPYFIKVKPTLVKTLKESRNELNPVKLLELQLNMAAEIIALEKQISQFSRLEDREKHNDAWLSREVYKTHRRILKTIADGLAWRHLKCFRSPLRLLAEHNQTGHLSKGFAKEVGEAARILNQTGSIVLLNDITNVLRYGDLTIIQNDAVSFYEVKSGKRDGRAVSQSHKLDSVIYMLNSQLHTIGDQTAKVLYVPSRPTHFVDSVQQVIWEAKNNEDGIASSRLSPYLWLSCISVDKTVEYYHKRDSLPDFPTCPLKKGQYTVPFRPGMLFEFYSPNTAPYSIFPFDEEVIIDLLLGSLQIKAHLGEDELIKSFKGKGWAFEFPSIETRDEWLTLEKPRDRIAATRSRKYQPSLTKGQFTLMLPWDVLYRIGFEFLSVKAIVEMAELSKSTFIPSTLDYVVTEFLNEKDRWV